VTSSLALLALAAPLGFLAVVARALAVPAGNSRSVERLGGHVAWLGVVVAAAAGGLTVLHGSLESPTLGIGGLGFSIRLDAVSSVMLGMISLLGAVIVRYSNTYLDGDDRRGTFLGWLAATIAAVEILVLAGNLGLLVLAWIVTSLSLHRLLVFFPDRRRAVVAARKKFIAARIGDGFLLAGAALLFDRFDTGDLGTIFDGALAATGDGLSSPGSVELAALCFAVAAILKSAQFPTHGWLVEVMDTPTPVSALLHAGILNAGPFLVIRMSPVMDGAVASNALLLVVGGFTALFASVALLPQPTIKVALGYSSAAHMGFMLMVCAIGIYPAAFLHLVAHSFYKAHAFLSSGSAIDEARAGKLALPRRLNHPARVLGSLGLAVAMYLAFALLWGIDLAREPELLAIGLILVLGLAQIVAPALDSDGGLAGSVRAGLLAVAVTAAFFVLEGGTHHLLHGVVPDVTGREPFHLILLAGVLVAFATVVLFQILDPARPRSRRRQVLAIHMRNGLYANALLDRAVGALRAPATR
jgi:NAD(P)H-quinone oxidoreductase subunit 5